MSKADITPTEIVRDLFEEAQPYEKHRLQFKAVYVQLLSVLGFEETDWKTRRTEHRSAILHQNLIQANTLKGQDKFLTDIRPIFESAIRVESDFYQQMKKQLQTLFDFYSNQYETQKAELNELAPKLEAFQKNRPTIPDKIQEMDIVTAKFTELQRAIKSKLQPGIEAIQGQHLKVVNEVLETYQRQIDQWSVIFAPFAQIAERKADKDKEKHPPSKNKMTEREKKLSAENNAT